MRIPFLVIIITYTIAIIGLILIQGVDADGNPYKMSIFDAFYFISYTATTIGFGETPFPLHVNTISFDALSLFYAEKRALYDISFDAKRGEMIALIGDSGGGKSSLMNLLMRFYDPSSGDIKINDVSIKAFSLQDLRQNIGMVTQRVYIFNDTIAANVAYGKEMDEEN